MKLSSKADSLQKQLQQSQDTLTAARDELESSKQACTRLVMFVCT